MFTFAWLSASDGIKPVELGGESVGDVAGFESVGDEVSTGTDVCFGGRPSLGREAGLLPSRILATLHADQ